MTGSGQREAAIRHALNGRVVFPLRPGGKTPMIRHWKPGDTGGATTNLRTIGEWWRRHPDANIGAPTGVTFDAIDFDGPCSDSLLTSQDIEADFEPLCTVLTPNGAHVYVEPTGHGNRTGLLKAGCDCERECAIDFRGVGGYVVAAGSVVDGNPYIEAVW